MPPGGHRLTRKRPWQSVGDHLASGLCVAACEQRRRVRFTTATALVNELVEARASQHPEPGARRWERIELIGLDELGYVPLRRSAPSSCSR